MLVTNDFYWHSHKPIFSFTLKRCSHIHCVRNPAQNAVANVLTLLDVMSRTTPSGMKAMPVEKNIGRTVPAVIIGSHAGSFCCINLESIAGTQQK